MMNIIDIARTTTSLEEFERALAEREGKIKRALEKFNGTLSIQEIHDGIEVCFRNAKALCADSELLFAHERWPRSFALSISALEEVGKVVVLHSMVEIPTSKPKVWKQHWREARCHVTKTLYGRTRIWHDELYSQMGAQLSTDDLVDRLTERLRQGGLYVDFDQDDRKWRTPKEITKAMAEKEKFQAMESLSQLQCYRQQGLFNIEWLVKRAEICGSIYDNCDEVPEGGADRTMFFVELHKLRKRFFHELVNKGVLEHMLPTELE
jgi:AbiV family abortive infection protein